MYIPYVCEDFIFALTFYILAYFSVLKCVLCVERNAIRVLN